MEPSKRLRTFRVVFYSVFGLYHLVFLIFTLIVDEAWIEDNLMKVFDYISFLNYTKYIALFGLLLFVLDLIVDRIQSRSYKKHIAALETEILNLKAKLYDKKEKDTTTNDKQESTDKTT